jgi:hypothetical protein
VSRTDAPFAVSPTPPQFDVTINNVPAGRIVFRLFDSAVPHTARNFRELATGEHGYGYEGSKIHRIVPEVRPLWRPLILSATAPPRAHARLRPAASS